MNTDEFSLLPGAPGPLYRLQGKEANLYYAPGYLLRVDKASVFAVESQFFDQPAVPNQVGTDTLLAHSRQALQEWKDLLERPYQPQSLHLYLNRQCQLACRYCFSDLPDAVDSTEVSVDAVCAATRLVAKNCAERNMPLVIVFHGGGEPIVSWRLIESLQPKLRQLAESHGIPLFRYVATNGVMNEGRARWLARSFELVGLSIDGPPDIQANQRPFRFSGGDSTATILRTARILRESGTPVHARVTVTAQSASRQVEICRYLCENIFPQSISVEPVYLSGRANSPMQVRQEQLDDFVESFFKARSQAHSLGVAWQLSGARPAEVHGPYCNIFRQVLQLVPGDMASACFKDTSQSQTNGRGMTVGQFDGVEMNLDHERILALGVTFARPQVCESCLLAYHCTYNCPNACLLSNEQASDILCQILKRIFSRRLLELAGELIQRPGPIAGMPVTSV